MPDTPVKNKKIPITNLTFNLIRALPKIKEKRTKPPITKGCLALHISNLNTTKKYLNQNNKIISARIRDGQN
jgi:hypothetical protein